MRRIVCVNLGVLLLISVSAFAQGDLKSDSPRAVQLDPGKVIEGRYVNDSLGITNPLPDDGWYVSPDLANDSQRRLPGGSFLLLIADRLTGRPFRDRLLLIADDKRHYSPSLTLRDYVAKVVGAQAKMNRIEFIRDVFAVDYADKHYFRADFNDTSEGVLRPKSFIATDLNGFFMSWTFVAGSEDELAQLAESVRRASFHEKEVPILSEAAAGPTDETKCPVTDEQPPTEHPLRVRISQGVSQAMLCKKLRPIYPEAARQKRIEGMVGITAVRGNFHGGRASGLD